MKLYFAAWKDLISRYVTIWRGVWGKRHLLSLPPRPVAEREFLPAALEVEETPVSPLPRVAMGLIVNFALIALVWAVIGKLDVVVTAGGKIVPNERTKVIQPIETATVKAIYVQDGQQVKAGDILLELDATSADADERDVYKRQVFVIVPVYPFCSSDTYWLHYVNSELVFWGEEGDWRGTPKAFSALYGAPPVDQPKGEDGLLPKGPDVK